MTKVVALVAWSNGNVTMEEKGVYEIDDALATDLIAQGLVADAATYFGGGGSGGGVLVVTEGENNICDASYNDVISAVAAGKVVMLKTSIGGSEFPFGYKYLVSYMEHEGQYAVAFGEHYDVYAAQSATDALVKVE